MKRILRLQKAIVFTIVLSFILSPFFGLDVYHTVQAATVKVQKESMWCKINNTYVSDDENISITEWTDQTAVIICYKKKLYFKKYPNMSLDHIKSEKGGAPYTGKNYQITSSNSKVIYVHKDTGRYTLSAKKPGTATITVKDKKGNVLNKTKITVTKPTYRVDYKTLFKDLQNTKYTAGDTFYLSEYLLYNGKSLTTKQKEQANKYSGALECTSGGVSFVFGKRDDIGGGALGFSLSRYQTKQKADLHTSKNDVNEQRVLLFQFNKGNFLPEKTEVATKPEDESWHVYYKGETAKLPFSIKNQTPERLRELGTQGRSTIFPNFVNMNSFYNNNILYNDYDYEYLIFDTSQSYLEKVQICDALKDKYPDYISQEPLTNFWVAVLPISGENEIYYAERDEMDSKSRKWHFPQSYNSTDKAEDWQINIMSNGIAYSTINQDNTFNDFYAEYGDKRNGSQFIKQEEFYDIVYGRSEWKVTVEEDGIQYSNQDDTLRKLDEKYAEKTEEGYYGWSELSDFYTDAINYDWKVIIEKDDVYYSTENVDNTINDFGRKYNLFINNGTGLYYNRSDDTTLSEDFSFTYELLYKGQQVYKINCHV